MEINQQYDLSITYTYRNGSQFTEHYAKPQYLGQMARKVEAARAKYATESNIVKIQYSAKPLPLDTAN